MKKLICKIFGHDWRGRVAYTGLMHVVENWTCARCKKQKQELDLVNGRENEGRHRVRR